LRHRYHWRSTIAVSVYQEVSGANGKVVLRAERH
jgi:hypothetical protein